MHTEVSFLYHNSGEAIFPCFKQTAIRHKLNELQSSDVLVLHGGADISPSFYGQQCTKRGNGSDVPTERDVKEWDAIKYCIENGIPMVGICRGAQMLCAADGGILIQHIEDHGGFNHAIKTYDDEIVITNSCHHQMMVPSKHAEILAVSSEPTIGYDEHNHRIGIEEVTEIVYFPKINAIGIQGHPEWAANTHFVRYCANLITNFLLKGK